MDVFVLFSKTIVVLSLHRCIMSLDKKQMRAYYGIKRFYRKEQEQINQGLSTAEISIKK